MFLPKSIPLAQRIIFARKAKQMLKTLGNRAAAGYLRNRGFSCEATLFILCGK